MFKKVILCLSIPLVMATVSPAYAQNADKVLSPVSPWVKERDNGCHLNAEFESQTKLILKGDRTGIKNIEIIDPSASFASLEKADLFLIPHGAQRLQVNTKSPQSFSILTAGIDNFAQELQSAVLAEIRLENKTYRFSLAGLKPHLPYITNCRRGSPLKTVDFNNVEKNYSDSERKTDEGTDPISLYPYLMPSEQSDTIEKVTLSPQDADVSGEQVVLIENADNTKADDESSVEGAQAQSIKRIHTPKAVIAPAPQIEVHSNEKPMGYDDLSESALKKPPEFDKEMMMSSEVASSSQRPVKEDMNENMPPAEELSFVENDEPIRRLASINDETARVYIEGTEYSKIQPALSQSAEQAITAPVVIPAIDIQSGQKRFDITNRKLASQSRELTNQDLEESLKKNITKPVLNESEQNEAAQVKEYPDDLGSAIVSVQPESLTTPAPPLTPLSNIATAQWVANAGQNLKQVISDWSLQEGVELIWDAPEQYEILDTLSTSKNYEQAIAGLLNQFMVSGMMDRPVGQLYIDPQSGKKMLIIQRNSH